MLYCHECGEKISPKDIFCPYCGTTVQAALSPPVDLEKAIAENRAENISVPESPISKPSEKFDEPEIIIKDVSLPIPKDFKGNSGEYADFGKPLPIADLKPEPEEILEIENSAIPNKYGNPTKENFSFANQEKTVEEIIVEGNVPETEKSKFEQVQDSSEETVNFDATIAYTEEDLIQNKLENSSEAKVSEQIFPTPAEEKTLEDAKQIISETPEYRVAESDSKIKADNNFADTLISQPLSELVLPQTPVSSEIQINKSEEIGGSKIESQNFEPQEPILPESSETENKIENSGNRTNTKPIVNTDDTGGKKAKLKPLSEGTFLNGRYKIVRKIGGGGMGAVYLAEDENLGSVPRAVKEMVQSYIEEDQQEKAVQDFKRESLLLSQLEHPAIPTIYDYFYDDKEGRFYLVMKYISGGDLASRLRSAPEGRLDEKTVTEWAIQIADVLDYLHTHKPQQIVYRDLKPSNIMIDGKNGKIMLIDFGIARSVNKEEKGVTAVGTMGYAPPELFSGNVEPRSDIYSLGSTMFHLLTGADPQNNPLLIFDFNKNPRPRQINPSLSDQIEKILMQAVEYSAERRFKSAAEMRDLLNKHLQNLETKRVSFGSGSRASAQPAVQSQPVFCGFCGQKIMGNDLFCPFCGAKQPIGVNQPKVSTAPANFVSAPATAKLIVINTTDLISPIFNLEKDSNLIGRRDPMSNIFPEIDLSKYDPQTKISRRHARIWRTDRNFMIEDLGSSNGTVLLSKTNETVRLMPQQPRPLTDGDKLKLGDTTLHFVVG